MLSRIERESSSALGAMHYRLDRAERAWELDLGRRLLSAELLPRDGETIKPVEQRWQNGERRKACVLPRRGPHARLLEVGAVTFKAYAERHRWDLVLSGEDWASGHHLMWTRIRLIEHLMKDYDLVLWIDADAVIVDFERDMAEELADAKDLYLVAQEGGIRPERVANSGVMMFRSTERSRRFLGEVWSRGPAPERG